MQMKSILMALVAVLGSIKLNAHALNNTIGAVASPNPLATQAGLDVLKYGGNAFDAAIAVASTLTVVEPAMSGLGGYGSILIYDAQKKQIRYLNACGKLPKSTNSDLMRSPTVNYLANRTGARSISTPSLLNAWKEMHQQYGQLPWKVLFKKAIYYANNGFVIPPYTAKIIEVSFKDFPSYAKAFYGKNGKPLREGEKLIQKDLAKTYKIIARKGTKPFYHGKIARIIDAQMQKLKSFLSLQDLKADTAEWRDSVSIHYKGYDIHTSGTPGNGFIALLTLGIMKHLPIEKTKHNSPQYLHMLLEALKESSKIRLQNSGSVEETKNITENILNEENFSSVADSIDLEQASNFETLSKSEGINTTHFVVIDRWGNIVNCTQTLGLGFGSKVMIEGTGIWMNSSIAFSTFEPKGNPMDAFPGKHKLSGNTPVIILKNSQPWAAFGTPGGHTIFQNMAQVTLNLIDFGMTMQSAIDQPKVAFIDEENCVYKEPSLSSAVSEKLTEMGHIFKAENIATYIGMNGRIGNAMGIRILNQKNGEVEFDVGLDRRKDAWTPLYDVQLDQ